MLSRNKENQALPPVSPSSMGSGSTGRRSGPGIVLPGRIRAVGRFTGLVQFALPVCAVRGGFGFRRIVLAFRSGLALRRRVIAFGHVALCLHASVSLGTQHGQLLIQGTQLAEHVAQRLGHGSPCCHKSSARTESR